MSSVWHSLIRGECINNHRRTQLTAAEETECLVDVGDRRNGHPEDKNGVKLTVVNGKVLNDGAYSGSRRRSWQRVKSVSELVEERFVVSRARDAAIAASGQEKFPTATYAVCKAKTEATCEMDLDCRWHTARMPHDSGCKSVWDIELELDEDQSLALGQKNSVRFEVRSMKSVEMDPPKEIKDVLITGFWEAGTPSTYPLWWREMLFWLKPGKVASEPSGREPIPVECQGRRGLMIFTTAVPGTGGYAVKPQPSVSANGESNWGGIKRFRQKMHYPRWIKRGNAVRCGCYPPPLSTMPEVDLYPGCAATENVCLTPPDWSMYS